MLAALVSGTESPPVRANALDDGHNHWGDGGDGQEPGTVEVADLMDSFTLKAGESVKYRLRLSKRPARHGPDNKVGVPENGWWIRIRISIEGEVVTSDDHNEDHGISWVPSVGWEIYGEEEDKDHRSYWTNWREVTIKAAEDADDATIEVSHEVWADNTYCPVHGVGERTGEVVEDGNGGGRVDPQQPPLPTLSIDDVSVDEEGGPRDAEFTVTLSESSTEEVTVKYETVDGSAQAGREDYTPRSGMLTFVAGDTTEMISVPVLDDPVVEPEETFIVTLSDPTHARIGDYSGEGTIISGDQAPRTVSFGSGRYSVTEGSAVTVTVNLSTPPADGSTLTIPLTDPPDGDATPEVDYSGIPESVTFGDSETSRTFIVRATEDEEDDDGEQVILEFDLETESWPSGLVLANPEVATITINEHQPADEQDNWTRRAVSGWLRRFGDTAAVHVLDALNERMRCAPIRRTGPGGSASPPARRGCEPRKDEPMSFVVAGRRLSVMPAPTDASEFSHPANEAAGVWALDDWPLDTRGTRALRSLTAREVLAGSAFHISPGAQGDGAHEEGRRFSFWGRGALSAFDTEEGGDIIDGDVTSATFGLDFADRRLLAGFAISHSEGDGSFSRGGRAGKTKATLTGVYPYLYYGLNELVSVWGAAGFGSGTLSLRLNDLESEAKLESKANVASRMGAVGVRRELLYPAENWGGSAALKADALLTRTTSDASRILAGTRAAGNRQRIAMEVAQEFTLALGAWVAPFVEIGARRDGGAGTGEFGLEVNSGFRYEYPLVGWTAEFGTRGLFGDGVNEFDELGVSGSFRYDPVVDSELGPDFALSMAGGPGGWLDPETPWGHYTMDDQRLDGGYTPETRVDAEFAYGLPVLGGSDTTTPWLGASMSERWRDLRLGYRRGFGSDMSVGVEGTLRQSAIGEEPSDYAVMLRLSIR